MAATNHGARHRGQAQAEEEAEGQPCAEDGQRVHGRDVLAEYGHGVLGATGEIAGDQQAGEGSCGCEEEQSEYEHPDHPFERSVHWYGMR